LLAIGWPFAHILILLLVNAIFDRAPPIGDSMVMFFATGLVPFMVFNYMSRFMMIAVLHARPLLSFPAVKIVDLLTAGALLELLSSCCMIIVLAITLMAFGIDVVPQDPIQAGYALLVSMLLGLSFGVVSALAALAHPMFVTGSVLLTILLYMVSGIFFVPDAMPPGLRYYLWFNPLLQAVEWMRSAYYDGYGSLLNKTYAVGVPTALLFVGLAIERMFRGRFLIAK
jgi:capsular polysaccharide transport system permease protein